MYNAILLLTAPWIATHAEGQDLALKGVIHPPLPPVATTTYEPATAAAPAQLGKHDEGLFLELGGGLVTTTNSDGPGEEIDFDEGYGAFIGIGKRFAGAPNNIGFDVILEGFLTDQDVGDDGVVNAVNDITAAGLLISGLVDFEVSDSVSLYAGPGVGVSWLDVGTNSDSINDFDEDEGALLTWEARAGARFRLAERTSAFIGYRFLNIDDAEIDDDIGAAGFDLQTEQHILEAGLRFGPAGV